MRCLFKSIFIIISVQFILTIPWVYAQDTQTKSTDNSKPNVELKLPDQIDENEETEDGGKQNDVKAGKSQKFIKKSRKHSKKKGKVKRKGKRKGTRKGKRVYPLNRPKRALKSPPPLGKIPFALGERLTYKINLMNAHSGDVVLKVGKRGVYKGTKVIELSGNIKSSPFIENFYPIRDRLVVLVDEKTFLPVKSDFYLNEKKRESSFHTEFNTKTGHLKWQKKSKGKNKSSKKNYQGPGKLYESLSSLYALRRLELKVGLHFEQYVWSGRRERLVDVKVIGEERVLTDLGWFDTYKVEISSIITGGFVTKRSLKRKAMKGTAWIAKDKFLTPIKLITPTKLGEAEAILTRRDKN